MNSALLNRIQKLLRLASNNPSVEESASAFAKAQTLATEAGLDLAILSLQGEELPAEEIDEKFVECGQRFPVEYKFVSTIIKQFLGVSIINHGGRTRGRSISFIGPKSDTGFAIWLYEYLIGEFYRLWEIYRKNNPSAETGFKNSFYFGVHNAIIDKINEGKKQAVDKGVACAQFSADTIKEQFALMVVNQEKAIAKFIDEKYEKIRRGKAQSISVRADVMAQGYEAGKTVSLNRPLQ